MAKTILIIDDEELILKSLRKFLETRTFNIVVAKKASDAVSLAKDKVLDLIITDIRMPGMTGIEAVKMIHENQVKAGVVKVPVIFITGFADEECEGEAQKLNPIGYVYKPFDLEQITKLVNKALML